MAVRLVNDGQSAYALTDAVIQYDSARRLSSCDVCLAVSGSGLLDSHILRSVDAARSTGATVIGITGDACPSLMELADVR